ncbi:MAG: glycosyltransferase family 39 protein [Chloroflexi bacterium]|nr:glycosyltransferase family 39 protein [Chloroflexota bacterium]
MGVVTTSVKEKRFWNTLFLAGLIAGLVLRFYLASFAKTPGHGDSAFYYTVAKNIALGRGPVIDYIVYFFSGLLPLPHYAGDFWNPGAAFLISIPMILFGTSLSSALAAPIITGIVPALVGYWAGRKFSGSIAVGSLAGILTFFSPFQVWYSVTTEAIIFSGAFGALAIYFIMKSDESPRYFLAAAIFTGFAQLIRQDNILLLATLEVCVLLASLSWKRKLAFAAAALGIHLLILSPLILKNFSEFRAPFPPGPAKTAFLTTYEDFHSYGKRMDWYSLRAAWGIRGIITRKLHTAQENLGQVNYYIDPVFSILFLSTLAGTAILHRKKNNLRLLLPVFLFALFEYLFYSFIASFSGPGSLIKILGILMPFISIVIVDFFANHLRPKSLLITAMVLLSIYSGYRGFQKNYSSAIYYNGVYDSYKIVKSVIVEDAGRRGLNNSDITVLARDTWDVYEGTGFKTVMVPNNDLNTMVYVAQHYNARYILLPAQRSQLDKIYNGTTPDPRFRYVAAIPNSDLKIFWIDFEQK